MLSLNTEIIKKTNSTLHRIQRDETSINETRGGTKLLQIIIHPCFLFTSLPKASHVRFPKKKKKKKQQATSSKKASNINNIRAREEAESSATRTMEWAVCTHEARCARGTLRIRVGARAASTAGRRFDVVEASRGGLESPDTCLCV